MTEQTDDIFSQWLDTGTVSQRSVDVFARPDLFARYEHLAREHEVAQQVEKAGDRSLGDRSLADIEEQLEALYAEWQASKMVWFIRALSADEIDEITEKAKFPEAIDEKKASEDEKLTFRREVREANTRSNVMSVQRALVKVEDTKGTAIRETITEAEVWKMRDQLGDQQVMKLVTAALMASSSEVAMPVPSSLKSSRGGRSS